MDDGTGVRREVQFEGSISEVIAHRSWSRHAPSM
jgi:hypothetical protein